MCACKNSRVTASASPTKPSQASTTPYPSNLAPHRLPHASQYSAINPYPSRSRSLFCSSPTSHCSTLPINAGENNSNEAMLHILKWLVISIEQMQAQSGSMPTLPPTPAGPLQAGGLWGDVFDDDPPEGLRSKQQMAA